MWSGGREQFAFLVQKSLDQEKKPNSDSVWTMRSWTSSSMPWFGKNLGALGTRVSLFWIWERHRYLFMNKREAYGTSVQKIFTPCLFQLPRRKHVFLSHWFWVHSYVFLWLVRCGASRDLKCVLIDGLASWIPVFCHEITCFPKPQGGWKAHGINLDPIHIKLSQISANPKMIKQEINACC